MLSKKIDKKAFTLIEVVLVLAIGGLIFLLAFIAYSQVSRNRRDSQRRQDAGRIFAELNNFYTDNGFYPNEVNPGMGLAPGNPNFCVPYPSSSDHFRTFTANYLCGNNPVLSPSGVTYGFIRPVSGPPAIDNMIFRKNRSCGSETVEDGIIRLEMGLETGVVCRDSR